MKKNVILLMIALLSSNANANSPDPLQPMDSYCYITSLSAESSVFKEIAKKPKNKDGFIISNIDSKKTPTAKDKVIKKITQLKLKLSNGDSDNFNGNLKFELTQLDSPNKNVKNINKTIQIPAKTSVILTLKLDSLFLHEGKYKFQAKINNCIKEIIFKISPP